MTVAARRGCSDTAQLHRRGAEANAPGGSRDGPGRRVLTDGHHQVLAFDELDHRGGEHPAGPALGAAADQMPVASSCSCPRRVPKITAVPKES